VKRRLSTGDVAEFTAKEFWLENYAIKGGKEKSIAPNAMWTKRPYGQIAKCAEAQALRRAFPELGSQPTSDETIVDPADIIAPPTPAAEVLTFSQVVQRIDAARTIDELNALKPAIRGLDRDGRAEATDAAKVRAGQIRAQDVTDIEPTEASDADPI